MRSAHHAARLVLLTLVLSGLTAACGDPDETCFEHVRAAPNGAYVGLAPEPGGRLRLHFDDGTELTVPRSPQRIVTALPGITEMVAFLGSAPQLVGVSDQCDYPERIRDLPRVRVQPFDPETVLVLQPDLVIVDRRLHRRDLSVIRRRVPAVLPLDTSRSLAHLATSMDVLAAVLNTDKARDRALRWRARMNKVVARIEAGRPSPPPRVFCAWGWEPIYALGPGSLLDDLLRICGCINIACDLRSDASGTFPEELVLQRRPDWILTSDRGLPDRIAERWQRLPAITEGQVADGSADDLVRAGPRILNALERLADVLRGKRPASALRGVGD